ncbi:multiple epidermal growth factor-like domains protein 6 [Pecten maximus]|uniref:multiple epidermal growth factor-like domains protein 6 n=1 Tax=Pecten maximus TaxID=6579 RepID=UPI00145806A4|nr:multiple epidermal growth factor-like domains protein 6 [Pecten maximus]
MATRKILVGKYVVLILFFILDTIRSENGYQHRFAGYQLYVSNTTNSPTDGVLCFEDNSSTNSSVQLVVTHQCPYVGQYVTVYNYRSSTKRYNWYSDEALLELCEVQVFGCQVGRYGDGHCNNQCPGTCYGGNCNSTTAACFYCIPGKYGNTCDQDCPANCRDMLCEKSTGNCIDCVPQTYGIRCEYDCSTSCQGQLCEKVNGNCYDCVPQKYGIGCEQSCSTNCQGRLCEKVNGNCDGCIAGWYDVTCLLTCPVTCKDFLCHPQTGHCLDCYPGKYGVVCGADCPDTCTDNICNKDNGHCLSTGLTTESPNTNESSVESYLIAVLAVVCGLFLAALGAIAVLVFFLR